VNTRGGRDAELEAELEAERDAELEAEPLGSDAG
jgi:hypothetical protein